MIASNLNVGGVVYVALIPDFMRLFRDGDMIFTRCYTISWDSDHVCVMTEHGKSLCFVHQDQVFKTVSPYPTEEEIHARYNKIPEGER